MAEPVDPGRPIRRGWSGTGVAERDAPFALFVESVKDYAIFMLDTSGHVITWNVGAERLKGYRSDEIVGRHFSVFYPPEDRAQGKPERLLKAAAADGRVEDEGWRVRQDGTRFWADVVITAVRDSSGELIAFGKVTRDMTEVQDRRAALEAANDQLRSANQALETFTRSLTHDIGGPLRTIQGFAEILEEEYGATLDDQGRDYVRRVASGARRLSALVQGLLVLFRITRTGERPPLQRVSLDAVVRDVLRQLIPELEQRSATVHVVGSLGDVVGYPEALTVILDNLVRNAIKFVTADVAPRVSVTTARRGTMVRLIVEDNGIGIPAGEQRMIFEPFKRLHARAEFEGTGLGLAIVQHAAARMGGASGVESEVGRGSRFWVELQVAD